MANTIQQALRPVFLVYFIFGLSVYPLKQSNHWIRWIVYSSVLYSLIVWFLYAYVFSYIVVLLTPQALLFSPVDFTVLIVNILTTIISAFMCLYYQKRFEICMIKLDTVDDTLEELGTPKIHLKICRWSKRLIVGWLVYIFLINCYDVQWWLNRKQSIFWALFLPWVFNYSTNINILVDLLFIIFLWHLHLELRRIARELNLMFGMQMTLETMSYLIYTTSIFYNIFVQMWYKHTTVLSLFDWFITIIWLFSFIGRLYIMNYMCDIVSLKANGIGRTIHQLTNVIRYNDVRKEIYQFTLQVMHYPLNFNGMGLFHFGQKFVWKFYVKITTFVIIMIQMKL